MALERGLEGRDQLLKLVKRHAREIQELHRTGLQLDEPYTSHGSCLLSRYGDVRGASYQKESGINSIRYLVKLEGHWVYSLCILEGYSRTILAGMASEHQELPALLPLLFAALSTSGGPEGIVSDHGAVFRAGDYVAILKALEIEPTYIELRKPWQNLIEAQFKVQLRLADFQFEQAGTVEEVQTLHAAFVETFNTTRHWAHQARPDGRRTPAEVLGWVRGRAVEPERLRHLFGQVQFLRTVNAYGF